MKRKNEAVRSLADAHVVHVCLFFAVGLREAVRQWQMLILQLVPAASCQGDVSPVSSLTVLADMSSLNCEYLRAALLQVSQFAMTNTITEQRKLLPVYEVREELLQVIRENQVVVIVGETGSGKTTQVLTAAAGLWQCQMYCC